MAASPAVHEKVNIEIRRSQLREKRILSRTIDLSSFGASTNMVAENFEAWKHQKRLTTRDNKIVDIKAESKNIVSSDSSEEVYRQKTVPMIRLNSPFPDFERGGDGEEKGEGSRAE